MRHSNLWALGAILLLGMSACSKNDDPTPDTPDTPAGVYDTPGFYLLNQGNMGMNQASIDFYNASDNSFTLDVYTKANPTVAMSLGDVGNQIAIYNDQLWAVVNGSNKVEVMNAADCVRIGQIDVPNCRYIAFDGNYAYVTSYAGPVDYVNGSTQIGYVAKIDVESLKEVGRCNVGCQPDGIAIAGGKIYVANSNGYADQSKPGTVSVISVASFQVEKEITVGVNLNQVVADKEGKIWITSRGNYGDIPSRIHCYDPAKDSVVANLDVPNSNVALAGNVLYVIGTTWDMTTYTTSINYAQIDTNSMSVITDKWSGSNEFYNIVYPYGIAVDATGGNLYITDAGDFQNPGTIYCFDADKSYSWSKRTGICPASIAFTE